MSDLRWSWLGAPYLVCAAAIAAVALAAALVRGDRVLRLGVIGASVSALPWAICQAFAAFTDDPLEATRLLRLGQSPIALAGPNLLLVLLGVSGQLERHRWIARLSFVVGTGLLVAGWATDWVVPGVQRLPAGMFYMRAGSLTWLHTSQLVIWLGVGLLIARRTSTRREQRRNLRLVLGVFIAGAISSIDLLLLYRVWGVYPIAWLPATVAAAIALYMVTRSDLLRPQGLDRGVLFELGGYALATGGVAFAAYGLGEASPVALAMIASLLWSSSTGVAWAVTRSRPVRVAGERALEQFVARVATIDDEHKINERLVALWRRTLAIEVLGTWWNDGEQLVAIGQDAVWPLDPDVIEWLVVHGEAVAVTDLATMRLGALRGKLEALGTAHGAGLIVPLVDRGELVGLVEASHDKALRESERGFVAESARATARALTFVGLARAAARERDTAREVEVADALRLQASASRDAELGRWVVAAEYRTAPRTTGAGWSAIELADGRLAVMVTEAQAHGVAAALATAALTGAFVAATSGGEITLAGLLDTMQASSEGLMRGGEPVAAFIAILDAHAVEWACAGHPGAFVVGPIATVDAGLPLGSGTGARPKATPLGTGTAVPGGSLAVATRGKAPLPADTLVVIASTALRGPDDERWQAILREAAPASGRLATVLVDNALRAGEPQEDLLAVVVRTR